jgi:SAM-dependent methyltransferase
MTLKKKKWYRSWFNSPYYHILYANRDLKEAEIFIDNICNFLKIKPKEKALDIGCGRGRHSIYLNQKGLDVVGIDLSDENIRYASQFENPHLHFFVHDMRNLLYSNYFDYVFNLFTSFGYFSRERDNYRAINTFSTSLKKDGVLILDFFNADRVSEKLVKEEIKTMNNITFHIRRRIENYTFIKEISLTDKGETHHFKEEVRALRLSDFEKYFEQKNLKILHLFGDYSLNDFDPKNSERLIIIAKRT